MTGRRLKITIWIAALAAVPLLYVGSYLALVRRNEEGLQYIPMQPDYGDVPRIVPWIFGPIHSIDRKVRPDYWEEWKAEPIPGP